MTAHKEFMKDYRKRVRGDRAKALVSLKIPEPVYSSQPEIATVYMDITSRLPNLSEEEVDIVVEIINEYR